MIGARRVFAVLSLGGVFFAVQAVLAQSSSNFQNTQSSFAPAVFDASSPSFQISGSVEHIVGDSQSPSFNTFSGVPLPDPAASICGNGIVESGEVCDNGVNNGVCPKACSSSCSTNSCGGGGGGAGGGGGGPPYSPPATTTVPTSTVPSGIIAQATLNYKSPTFKSIRLIWGSRPIEATQILVNGSTNGVRFLDPLRWERDLPVFLGLNDIYVVARNSTAKSIATHGQIDRMLIGDVNRSRNVDDVDLSLFTRAWKAYTFFADFNEDAIIDDADLSLLASHWNQSF